MPFEKAPRPLVAYREEAETDAVLAAPGVTTPQGRRDHALLLFLYNTGVRADGAARARVADRLLPASPERDTGSVLIHGKGDKHWRCPLWASTVDPLAPLVRARGPGERVLLNRRGRPVTRGDAPAAGGGDINTIRACLGCVSPATTTVCAEVGLGMTAKALADREAEGKAGGGP